MESGQRRLICNFVSDDHTVIYFAIIVVLVLTVSFSDACTVVYRVCIIQIEGGLLLKVFGAKGGIERREDYRFLCDIGQSGSLLLLVNWNCRFRLAVI